jgi:hypothetical protein
MTATEQGANDIQTAVCRLHTGCSLLMVESVQLLVFLFVAAGMVLLVRLASYDLALHP